MSNEQLAIMISLYRQRLEREIETLRDLLPAECPRYTERVYTGNEFISLFDKNPEHWETMPGDPIALDGLKRFVDELRESENVLKKPDSPPDP